MFTFIAVAFPAPGRPHSLRLVLLSSCPRLAMADWVLSTCTTVASSPASSSVFKDLVTLGPSTLLPRQGGQASDLNCPCQVLGIGTWTPGGAGLWGSQTVCALAMIRVMPSPRATEASGLGNVGEVSPGASQVSP